MGREKRIGWRSDKDRESIEREQQQQQSTTTTTTTMMKGTAVVLCAFFCLAQANPLKRLFGSFLADPLKESLLERIERIEAGVQRSATSWQGLHLAAAASCRAITGGGGTGGAINVVYPRTKGHSCLQVCQASAYKNCDGSLSIMGMHARAAKVNQPVGYFYNYGCKSAGGGLHETDGERDLTKETNIVGYCCYRR